MDPYSILQIDKNSSLPQIKSSYKKLLLKYHPDKNSSPDSTDHFIQLNNAYRLLSSLQYDSIIHISYSSFIHGESLSITIHTLDNIICFHDTLNCQSQSIILSIPPKTSVDSIISSHGFRFKLLPKYHPHIKHYKSNLIIITHLPFFKALLGLITYFPLGSEKILIHISHPIYDKNIIFIGNFGLYDSLGCRGKFFLQFTIINPTSLTPFQSSHINLLI